MSDLVTRVRAAPPRAGRTRVLAIDGRSGSGKTTLARRMREELNAPLITMEGLYEGWDGLDRGIELLVSDVLEPLAQGRTAQVPQYDWHGKCWGKPLELAPPELLVLEGVGAGARRAAAYASVLVWMTETDEVRKERALARDGDTYRPYWEMWAAQEADMLERERTWERADIVLSSETGIDR